ncbi:MAG: GtrA family protein [Opitutales bacterium]
MRKLFRHYLRSHSRLAQFLRFATVGAKISLIDAGGVYLLPWLFGLNLYVARALSLSTALLVGYLLNRYFTFGRIQKGGFYRQMAGHFGVHLLGSSLNFAIYSLIVRVGHHHLEPGLLWSLLPLFGLLAGGIVGMTFNFFFSSLLVFQVAKNIPPEASCHPSEVFAGTRSAKQEG